MKARDLHGLVRRFRLAAPRPAWQGLTLVALMRMAHAGPHAPAAGHPGSDAVAADDPRLVGWAVEAITLHRGPEEIDDPHSPPASYGSEMSAIGPADVLTDRDQPEPGSTKPKPSVSLGDGGSITLRFHPPVRNGPGPDIAVFENGLSFHGGTLFFMELAFVEASSDGKQFFRFPSLSETQAAIQIGSFGAIDPTNVHNLAGKYLGGFGTPFDLSDLGAPPGFDPARVTHVRVIDVVGSIDPRFASHDSLGRTINDPWPTFLTTSGFDLDAVGVLNQGHSGYAAWRAAHEWSAADSDPAADPDGDGVSNIVEYALDLHPLQPAPAPPVTIALGENGWVATPPSWRSGASDVVVLLEISNDLQTWSPATQPGPVPLGSVDGPTAFSRMKIQLLSAP